MIGHGTVIYPLLIRVNDKFLRGEGPRIDNRAYCVFVVVILGVLHLCGL
jgi:hypothetical protein